MEMKNKKSRGLGRGLSALMADVALDTPEAGSTGEIPAEKTLPIEALVANPDQPRKDFLPAALQELAESIREKGHSSAADRSKESP